MNHRPSTFRAAGAAPPGPDPSCGVVLVATGPRKYVELAARAAASVKRHCPGLEVDLFTDAEGPVAPFDRVHALADPWFRSKIDALLLSRFERTLYLDSDVLVLADIRDTFEVLERFDIALVHDWYRNSPLHHSFWRRPLPAAFPQYNGGLIALRRNPATTDFLHRWKAAVQETDTGRDQITLRELLWESDLRIATMPEEYNLLQIQNVRHWRSESAAPRVLHSPQFHREFDRYARAKDPAGERLGLVGAARLPMLLAADRGLARLRGGAAVEPGFAARLAIWARIAAGLPGRLAGRARRLVARPAPEPAAATPDVPAPDARTAPAAASSAALSEDASQVAPPIAPQIAPAAPLSAPVARAAAQPRRPAAAPALATAAVVTRRRQ